MPLSKYPIEIPLGGAVDESSVPEVVQPPRIREATECASIKGGAYSKRDEEEDVRFVPDSTQAIGHSEDVTVAALNTVVQVYPDDGSTPSSSNPAPYTRFELQKFEPTEADAVKEHGDSATIVVNGVPRTLCAWNVDPQGAYEITAGLSDPAPSPVEDPGAPSTTPQGGTEKRAWWAFLPTGGVRFAVFDGDRQVGSERELPTPPVLETPDWGFLPSNYDKYPQAQGGPCFPRVRSYVKNDGTGFFVSVAGLATPQQPQYRGAGPEQSFSIDSTTVSVGEQPVGARLHTYIDSQFTPGQFTDPGGPRFNYRDIMDRTHYLEGLNGYVSQGPAWDPNFLVGCNREGPGLVITLHDLDGAVVSQVRGGGDYALEEGPGFGQPTFRPNSASTAYPYAYDDTNPNNTLALPGPPLDAVSRIDDDGEAILYTLHVDYNQTFPTFGAPPYIAGEPYQAPGIRNPEFNTTRVMKWRINPTPPAGDPPIKLVSELYINDPQYSTDPTGAGGNNAVWCWDPAGAPITGYGVQPPAWSGGTAEDAQCDWPAGLHDLSTVDPAQGGGDGLLLVFSSTRTVTLSYGLSAPGAVRWSDPFWPDGDLCRLKISRMNPEPDAGTDSNMDIFPRYSTTVGSSDNGPTMQMARGAWAGSFLAPDGDGSFWLGVQTMTDQANVPPTTGGSPGTPQNSPGGPLGARTCPQTVSGSVVHALVELGPFGASAAVQTVANTEGVLPGTCIASGGVLIPEVGPCVALHASAPGDDRTGIQEISAEARSDVLSATAFLATRRQLPPPRLESGAIDEASFRWMPANYPSFCGYNTAVAIAQAIPFGQALGTFQVNPYQCRVNLRLDPDGVARWTAFQRYRVEDSAGSASIPTDARILKPTGSSASSAPYELYFDTNAPLSAQMVSQNGYTATAGAAAMVVGGPQGFLAGIGLQVVLDYVSAFTGVEREGLTVDPDQGVVIDPIASTNVTQLPTSTSLGDLVDVSAEIVLYDERGGAHRTVPHVTSTTYAYGAPSGDDRTILSGVLYGTPWQLAGIPLSAICDINVCVAKAESGAGPVSVSLCKPPFVTHEQPLLVGPLWPSSTPFRTSTTFAEVRDSTVVEGAPGDGAVVYTWAGELAADAPDPSAGLAAASNRLWSLSSVDRRRAQYTKLLRAGYAPEWNQNLSVRVPSTREPLNAIAALPDGRVLLFSPNTIHYVFGDGPSDTGQGSGFSEPAYLTTDLGCVDPASVLVGDYGCIFRSKRGFYLVDRQLSVTYVGLPYEDTTGEDGGLPRGKVIGCASDALRSESLFFTDVGAQDGYEVWVYNTLRGQWSTFFVENAASVTEQDGRPLWLTRKSFGFPAITRFTSSPAPLDPSLARGLMSLATGWLPMGRVQGFGRIWEAQLSGERDPGSNSGLRVEVLYDYQDVADEVYDFDDVGNGPFKVRFRPRKQKCEAISFRFVEYLPTATPPIDPATILGWRLDMCTVLAGVKAGLDKVPVTVRSS